MIQPWTRLSVSKDFSYSLRLPSTRGTLQANRPGYWTHGQNEFGKGWACSGNRSGGPDRHWRVTWQPGPDRVPPMTRIDSIKRLSDDEPDVLHIVVKADPPPGLESTPHQHVRLEQSDCPALYDFLIARTPDIPTVNHLD